MQKGFSYFFILFGITLLVVSTSPNLMRRFSNWRQGLSGAFANHRANGAGDLADMSYLDGEKIFFEPFGYDFHRPQDTTRRNIDLYIWGDSYVKEVPDSAFGAIDHYAFGRRDYFDLRYKLDPGKKNILIIENGERFIRVYFKYLAIFDHVKSFDPAPGLHDAFLGLDMETIFNHDINHNLEYNLFSYRFADPIRASKAEMNYRLFNRASGDVALSDNGQYLFLRQTVAQHDPMSEYDPIGKDEFEEIASHMDTIYRHYRKEGFAEVYFSIIPNPATILQPEGYNNLIPALQQYGAEKGIPMIDVYTLFKKSTVPARLFRRGDTHWNNAGLQIWIAQVNRLLRNAR